MNAAVVPLTHTDDAPPPIAAAVTAGLMVSAANACEDPQPVTVYTTVTDPAVKPVTIPPCVIIAVPVPFCIDQIPPAVWSMNAGVVELTHTDVAPPPIAAAVTAGLMVSGATTVDVPQLLTVYSTITVPALRPVTTPPCVIIAVPVPFCTDQTPSAVASVNAAVVEFTHTEVAPPPIDATVVAAFTVSDVFAELLVQPVTVYTTVTVPAVKPVTTPSCAMLAVPVPGVIDQVPPVVASVKAGVVEFTQTVVAPPLIDPAVTIGFTVSVAGLEGVLPQVPITVTE